MHNSAHLDKLLVGKEVAQIAPIGLLVDFYVLFKRQLHRDLEVVVNAFELRLYGMSPSVFHPMLP